MESRFRVVYSGELRPEIRAQEAIRGFASRFKVPEDEARKLILGGKERILRRDMRADVADIFRIELEAIGLEVRVESMAPSPAQALALEPEESLPAGLKRRI